MRITLTVSKSMLSELDALREEEICTRSQYILKAIKEKNARETAKKEAGSLR